MPNWIDNRALWEMYDPGPRFLGGLQAGAQVGNLMLRAREQALMLPLQEQMYKNQAKAQDLAAQHSLLQIQQQSLMLQNERDTLPLKLKATQDSVADQKALSEARIQWSLGNRVEPTLNTAEAANAWEHWKSNTQVGEAVTAEAKQYRSLATSIVTDSIRSQVDLLPKGEGGRYSPDQWGTLNTALAQDKSARIQRFEQKKSEFMQKAQPGERITLIDPETGKPEIVVKPIIGQGGAIGAQAENALAVKINDYRNLTGEEPDAETVARFKQEADREVMAYRKTPIADSITRTEASSIFREIGELNKQRVLADTELNKFQTIDPSNLSKDQKVSRQQNIEKWSGTITQIDKDISQKRARLEDIKKTSGQPVGTKQAPAQQPSTATPSTKPDISDARQEAYDLITARPDKADAIKKRFKDTFNEDL